MSQHPHDGSADDGLSGSLLRFIEEGQLEPLRQALSGFNHRCRNLLNSMKMGFYLTRRAAAGPLPDRWDELHQTYGEVERLFDLIQSIYRTMSLTLVRRPFRAILDERSASWAEAFALAGASLTIRPPADESTGEFDAMRLSSALDGFVSWRASQMSPGGEAILSWQTIGRHFQVEWSETAPSKPAAAAAAFSSPYAALASTTRSLALPLLARVVSEHRGRLSWTQAPTARAQFRWPLIVADPGGAVGGAIPMISHASLAPSLG